MEAQRETTEQEKTFALALEIASQDIFQWAKNKGFWDFTVPLPNEDGGMILNKKIAIDNQLVKSTKLMLMVSELAECLEGLRTQQGVGNEAEELADCIIRILDYCGAYELPIGFAIVQKMAKNNLRPHKHGKQF